MGGPKQAGWDHFVQQKMVLGPNQAAIFGPPGPKFDPEQKIRDTPKQLFFKNHK